MQRFTLWVAAVVAALACTPVGAQMSTKPSGTLHGRITHVERHHAMRCRNAHGRFVACAKKPKG